MISSNLCLKSVKSVARQKIAITSLAAVILKDSFLPSNLILLKDRSFISIHLLKVTSWISSLLSWYISLSITAAIKLLAVVIAWKSPVKCKFISFSGNILAFPPPVAPPLSPKTGPIEGSLKLAIDFFPIIFKASFRPIATVVFPSPYFVGVVAVTNITFPLPNFSLLGTLAIKSP